SSDLAGIHGVEILRRGAGFLSQVQTAAEFHDSFIQVIQEFTQTWTNRKAHADVPAWHRVAQRRFVAWAKQLEYVQRGVVARLLHIANNVLERLSGVHWNHELVLREALGTRAAVPLTSKVERLVELCQILDLVLRRCAHGVVGLTDGHERKLIHGPG